LPVSATTPAQSVLARAGLDLDTAGPLPLVHEATREPAWWGCASPGEAAQKASDVLLACTAAQRAPVAMLASQAGIRYVRAAAATSGPAGRGATSIAVEPANHEGAVAVTLCAAGATATVLVEADGRCSATLEQPKRGKRNVAIVLQ
jgi:hypothetical protein